MACIKKITDDLAFDCNNPGLIAGIVGVEEAIIINFEDVSSVSATPSTGSALITLKAGTKGYTIQCVKNSVQITEAARANDNAPTMLELTAPDRSCWLSRRKLISTTFSEHILRWKYLTWLRTAQQMA